MPSFEDEAPTDARITPYDEQHLVTYLRLLDAKAEGADWREVVSVIFGLSPSDDHNRAQRVYTTHLARAEWMTASGYRDLLNTSTMD